MVKAFIILHYSLKHKPSNSEMNIVTINSYKKKKINSHSDVQMIML